MNYIKQISVIVVLCTFVGCGSSKNDTPYSLSEKTPFTISYGSFQEWIAGVQGVGSGVNMVIHFEEVLEGVVFQELYFRNQISEVKEPIPMRLEGYFKGTVNREIIMDGDPLKEAVNIPPTPFPFKLLRDEAVLSYVYKGKILYTKIGSLIEEKPIAYPSAPPGGEDGRL